MGIIHSFACHNMLEFKLPNNGYAHETPGSADLVAEKDNKSSNCIKNQTILQVILFSFCNDSHYPMDSVVFQSNYHVEYF